LKKKSFLKKKPQQLSYFTSSSLGSYSATQYSIATQSNILIKKNTSLSYDSLSFTATLAAHFSAITHPPVCSPNPYPAMNVSLACSSTKCACPLSRPPAMSPIHGSSASLPADTTLSSRAKKKAGENCGRECLDTS